MRLLSFLPKLLILALLFGANTAPAPAQVSVGVSINIGPPALPIYEQPPCPAPGYIWTPGFWAWGGEGYYWVPGTWVVAPRVGYLWTPGYWGWRDGYYAWHRGYWGPHVGYYGGINYGFGYGGVGYAGGGWYGGAFRYNTAVTNVNTTIVRNVYVDRTVVNNTTINNYNTTINRTSYNGGPGGIRATPTPEERAFRGEAHLPPTGLQAQHQHFASLDRNSFAAVNHGVPLHPAFERPLSAENRPALREHAFNGAGTGANRNFETIHSEHYGAYKQPGSTHGYVDGVTSAHPAYHAQTYHAQVYHAETYHPQAYHAQTYHPQAYHAQAYHAQQVHPQHHAPAAHQERPAGHRAE